ncbi:MAG TPA: PQQ-dependent sugar dehydrogenase, partial [Acidobacteriota bacterium]|nr:PQQ-dependent sugar dehydrogenase [Acidobacteriota bacterium]
FELVAEGLNRPIGIAHAGDGSGRLFVTEGLGRIRVIENGDLLDQPFLDISSEVAQEGEGALWDIAFHPNFSENGRFFISYPARGGSQRTLRVAEYEVDPENPNQAIPDETVVLDVPHPEQIHFGGDLEFGPDGMLYISSGDGSSNAVQENNAQSLETLLGKVLRIDVDTVRPFRIPSDNPFAGQFGARGEIWAYGFRNPFQMSFDPGSGRLFLGDVGNARIEEVDIVRKGGNYGWSEMEGPDCFPVDRSDCFDPDFILPIHSYGRQDGASVIGGRVYRGAQASRLWGDYVFADFVTRRFWALREVAQGQWRRSYLGRAPDFLPTTIGQDEDGNLYVSDIVNGRVFRVLQFEFSVLAQVAAGDSAVGPFATRILLVNNSSNEVNGQIQFTGSDGDPLEFLIEGQAVSTFPVSVPAGGTRVLAPSSESEALLFGWAVFTGDGPLQATALFQQLGPDSKVLAQAGVAASRLGRRLLAPAQRNAAQNLDTALALVNPWPQESVTLTLRVLGEDDQELASQQFFLGPSRHRALFLSEIGNLPETLEGRLVVEADRDIAATLLLTVNGQVSASLPVGD